MISISYSFPVLYLTRAVEPVDYMGHQVLLNKCLASLPLPSLLVKGNKDDGEVRGEVVVCHHHPGHL